MSKKKKGFLEEVGKAVVAGSTASGGDALLGAAAIGTSKAIEKGTKKIADAIVKGNEERKKAKKESENEKKKDDSSKKKDVPSGQSNPTETPKETPKKKPPSKKKDDEGEEKGKLANFFENAKGAAIGGGAAAGGDPLLGLFTAGMAGTVQYGAKKVGGMFKKKDGSPGINDEKPEESDQPDTQQNDPSRTTIPVVSSGDGNSNEEVVDELKAIKAEQGVLTEYGDLQVDLLKSIDKKLTVDRFDQIEKNRESGAGKLPSLPLKKKKTGMPVPPGLISGLMRSVPGIVAGIGSFIVPIAATAMGAIATMGPKVMENIASTVTKLKDVSVKFGKVATESFSKLVDKSKTVLTKITEKATVLKNMATAGIDKVKNNSVVKKVSEKATSLKNMATAGIDNVKNNSVAKKSTKLLSNFKDKMFSSATKLVNNPIAKKVAVRVGSRVAMGAFGPVGAAVGAGLLLKDAFDVVSHFRNKDSESSTAAASGTTVPSPPKQNVDLVKTDGTTSDAVRDEIVEKVIGFEGGYVNHPKDSGGPTKYGIAYNHNKEFFDSPEDVKSLTKAKAKEIYIQKYWNTIGASNLPPQVALPAFDMAVHQGPGKAREALNVAAGGSPTPTNIAASGGATQVSENLLRERATTLRESSAYPDFQRGFENRISKVTAQTRNMQVRAATPSRERELVELARSTPIQQNNNQQPVTVNNNNITNNNQSQGSGGSNVESVIPVSSRNSGSTASRVFANEFIS